METPRDAIARVAETMFSERGFVATSVRAIAAEAGVDPALVIRHFGSKEQLFLTTARMDGAFAEVLVPPRRTLGARLVAHIVDGGTEQARGTYAALVWASSSPEVRRRLAEWGERELVQPLAALLSGDDATLRARLAVAQLDGLRRALWVSRDERLLGAPQEVVRTYGAAVQRTLNGA